MRSRVSGAPVAWLLVAALAAACGTTPAPSGTLPGASSGTPTVPVPAPAPKLDGPAWTLASLGGRPVPADAGATLRFDGQRVSGSDGCNRFTGPWSGSGASLRIGPDLAVTRRACPAPQDALAAEFGRALAATSAWRIDGATLVLLDAAGRPLASLDPQPTGLAGTAWRVVAYNSGRGSVVDAGAGADAAARPTIEFGTAGGVRGSGGCNTYSGSWTESAGRLSIGPLRTTRMACADPPDAMAREAAFLAALASATTARREGDRLELRTANGALAVSAVASPAR